MTFASLAQTNRQQINRSSAPVYDLRVTLNDEPRFFIIQIPSAKERAFLRAVETDKGFTLEDFGTILHRGWHEPNDELKRLLNEQYGMGYIV